MAVDIRKILTRSTFELLERTWRLDFAVSTTQITTRITGGGAWLDDKKYQVFISSTFEDLEAERLELWQRLIDLSYIVAGMESFPASSASPIEYIEPIIAQSDFFILILGDRYGSVIEGGDVSYTEKEYDYAVSQGIPVLVFSVSPEAERHKMRADIDAVKSAKLRSFTERVSIGRMITKWKNKDDLPKPQRKSFERKQDYAQT